MTTFRAKLLFKILTVTILAALFPIHTHAQTSSSTSSATDTRDYMIQSLASARTATDSITLLYNIYDLSNEHYADSVGAVIYSLARRQGYDDVAFDILRDLAQVHLSDDSILRRIQHILENDFPESDMQKETIVFVKIYRAYIEVGQTPEKELKEKIANIINKYGATYSSDPYERLMQQFLQCIFIGHETQGELLAQYIDILERLLQNMPRQSDKLKARLYRQKAYSYTVNADSKKAVEADRKLLELYDRTEIINHKQGRPYRNLNRFRHNSLSRMLTNYQALTINEADSIYDMICQIEKENPDLTDTINAVPEYKAYHMMAHGDYASAIQPLRSLIKNEKNHIARRILLKQLMTAAEATGNKSVLLEASTAYARSMEQYLDSKLSECIRELQIIYDVDHLQTDSVNTELQLQQQMGERHAMIIRIITWASVAIVILLIVFVVLYRRFRALSANLAETNRRLTAKHDELLGRTDDLRKAIDEAIKAERQKDAFIKYISATLSLPLRSMMEYAGKIINSSTADAKPFLKRFGDVISENSEALRRIAARLQHLSHYTTPTNDELKH